MRRRERRQPPRRRGPRRRSATASIDAGVWNPEAPGEQRWKALVFDATGIAASGELRELWAFFHPTIRRLVAVRPADRARHPARGLRRPRAGDRPARAGGLRPRGRQGGPRRRDRPAPLRRAGRRGQARLEPALLPLARAPPTSRARSPRIGDRPPPFPTSTRERRCTARSRSSPAPRAGSASRSPGSSRATARTSSGSTCPPLAADLERVTGEIGGSTIAVDITDDEAPATICDDLAAAHEGVDIVVHNAGVTRDKTLGGMDAERWDAADGHQPVQRGADRRRAARARSAAATTAGSSASPR